MNGTRYPVELRETETEFLLFTHPSQRLRAKSIDGWHWDPERRCWFYPKTIRVFDAIIAEFGDDLVPCSVRRPSFSSATSQATSLQEEKEQLQSELEKISQTLQLLSDGTATGSNSQIQALEAALAARQNELTEVRIRLQDRERRLEELQKEILIRQAENEQLQTVVAAIKSEANKRQGTAIASSVEEMCRQRAKDATGNDPIFVRMIDRLRLDSTFPIELGKCLEWKLREMFGCDDRSLSLYDLITQAKDAGSLSEEAIDLSHTIRKQRNIAAHDQLDVRTRAGRVLFSLFAASILWPQLPEGTA